MLEEASKLSPGVHFSPVAVPKNTVPQERWDMNN